ncbi:MAG: hypothetical protein RMK89_03850 [Armatimonadota bacterium]|nr:hypothetical protein [Armatimonadota bacterium]MDW8142578.1 hypothetical protein [Armatimonadota bacterium]
MAIFHALSQLSSLTMSKTIFTNRHVGSSPLQFLDLDAPKLDADACLLTKDMAGLDRLVELCLIGNGTASGIDLRFDPNNARH